MAYADAYSRDPAANSSPPPVGAPQGGLAVKRISATMRQMMAGVAECWNGATDALPGVKNLRGMAVQDPAAVAITGGVIGPAVELQGSADLVWGLDAQAFYDLLYEIGEVRWFAAGTAPRIPPLVTASWLQLANGFVVVTADGTTADEGTTLAGSWVTDDQGAIAAWAGAVDPHALSEAEMPSHGHPWRHMTTVQSSVGSNPTGGLVTSTGGTRVLEAANDAAASDAAALGGAGLDQPHVHTLTVPGATAHHHTLTPPRLFLGAWKRTA